METTNLPNVFPAPISVGPMYTPGCQSWGSTASYANMVTVATSCTAPDETARRDKYPNMYRIRSSAGLSLFARTAFMKDVASHWTKIGILVCVNDNPINSQLFDIFSKLSVKAGYEIIAYEPNNNFNDKVMQDLKQKDIRIFTIECNDGTFVTAMLCQAHKAGIRGSKYMFILHALSYSDANLTVLPQWCSRQTYIEQIQRSIYIGAAWEPLIPPDGVSELGHSLSEFDRLFSQYVGNEKRLDYFMRYLGYDVALHTLLALDRTERLLSKQNMSLRDYRKQPMKVMDVANISARDIRYRSIRYGWFHYSPRVEWDYEPQYITTWSLDKGQQARYVVTLRDNASVDDLSAFQVVPLIPINKEFLPNDEGKHVVQVREVSFPTFVAVICLSGIIFSWQLWLMFRLDMKIWRNLKNGDALLFGGLSIIDAAAVTFAIPNSSQSNASCISNVILTVAGISLFHSCLLFKLLAVQNGTVTNPVPKIDALFFGPSRPKAITTVQVDEKYVAIRSILFSSINIILVLSWFLLDMPSSVTSNLDNLRHYDEFSDTYFTYLEVKCLSTHNSAWLAALTVVNCLPPMVGALIIVQLRGTPKMEFYPPAKRLMLSIICSLTLVLVTVAIFCMSMSTVMSNLTMAYGLLIYSVFNGTLIYFKTVATKSKTSPATSVKPQEPKQIIMEPVVDVSAIYHRKTSLTVSVAPEPEIT